jgi:alpha-1,3-rhamnosyl/mannosyltransferase
VKQITLCVDALAPNPGGIGRYTWELCKGLEGHSELGPINYYGRGRLLDDPSVLLRGEPPFKRPNRFKRWLVARQLSSSLVHGPNYFLPEFCETGVITVHDLSVFRYPETHPADRVAAFEREFHSSLSRAAHIITDTHTVRSELIDDYGVAPDRITAIHLGVDPSFRPRTGDAPAAALRKWGLEPGHYGLCVSTLEPRKNISELLVAWRALPAQLRDRHPLVLCGGAGWRNDSLHELVRVGVVEKWLRFLGFVDEEELPHLYAGAALFIYPSNYEGFGLPPLEAMASGAPVMVANRSCLPEVCGAAARYFDPSDAAGFIGALEANLIDHEWRAAAARAGIERAREFTWQRCVDRTVEVYRNVARTAALA